MLLRSDKPSLQICIAWLFNGKDKGKRVEFLDDNKVD